MNRYRVNLAFGGRNVSHVVDASNIRIAAGRALVGLEQRPEIGVHVTLIDKNIVRPRREKFSRGRALSEDAS